ncbi:MAG TPA: CRTAC1 family protein [Planctomycetota bacterium]|nr:CRTAC1 family protein [Planctomycetota bacterium]
MRINGSTVALLALSSLAGCSDDSRASGARFVLVDVAPEAGIDVVNRCGDVRRWYIPESNGCGAAWLDVDGDGDLDLFVGNGSGMRYVDDGARLEVLHDASSRLYRNEGGMRFTDVTEASGAGVSAWINAVSVADIEGDGDPDLYLACFGRDLLLRNDDGVFTDATEVAGLGCELWGAGATFADADGDGDLDLYVANYVLFDPQNPPDGGRRQDFEGVEVGYGPEAENGRGFNKGAPDVFYRGDGRGHFSEATAQAGFGLEKSLCSYAAVFSDVDGDGDPDLLVANDLQPANLFINQGDGTFSEEGVARGFAFGAQGVATAAMGLFVEDIDGDGDQDVLRTNFDMEPNSLHINDGHGFFRDRALQYGLAEASIDKLGWGGGFFDAECDGDLDLIVANGHVMPNAEELGMHAWAQPTQLFEAVTDDAGRVRYRDATANAGPGLAPMRSARGVALADADDDGDVDMLIVDLDHPPRLLENQSPRRGRWIAVRLAGRGANSAGLGALVSVSAGARTWTREMRTIAGLYASHDPRLHFGLGPWDGPVSVEVRWPDGLLQVIEDVACDELLVVNQPKELHR